jgi:hypothetical protein
MAFIERVIISAAAMQDRVNLRSGERNCFTLFIVTAYKHIANNVFYAFTLVVCEDSRLIIFFEETFVITVNVTVFVSEPTFYDVKVFTVKQWIKVLVTIVVEVNDF